VTGNLVGTGSSAGPHSAYVFAIYDSHQKLQYIGFSQNLRNSLRTLLGRRPDKAHYYKAVGLPTLDQAAMLALREAWSEQVGGAPPGNKLAMERTLWQTPVDAGAISARGKRMAAEETARALVAQLRSRGLTEDLVANPSLLDQGLVDFLPVAGLSPEEEAAIRARQEEMARATRAAKTVIDGEERAFHVRYKNQQKANGGVILDAVVTMDNRETSHRIIIGTQYIEGCGLPGPEPAAEAALAVLLSEKVPRARENPSQPMPIGDFPVAYFTVSAVEQWFEDAFKAQFERTTGVTLPEVRQTTKSPNAPGGALAMVREEPAVAWRFTRRHSYGSALEAEMAVTGGSVAFDE